MPFPKLLPILKRLNAAVGYHNLGTSQDAWNELEDIDADDRAPAVGPPFHRYRGHCTPPTPPKAMPTSKKSPGAGPRPARYGPISRVLTRPHQRRGNLTPATPVASPRFQNKVTPSTMQSGLLKNLQKK